MSDLSSFNVTKFASGKQNLKIVTGIPAKASATSKATATAPADPFLPQWDNASAAMQLFYPEGSINPGNEPKGGAEIYASPLDISNARSATLQYSAFFPVDFDWVLGGKMPGLYGGHSGCSGGNAALDCFSTRLMWRQGGAGELYLVRMFNLAKLEFLTQQMIVRTQRQANQGHVRRPPVRLRCYLRTFHWSRLFFMATRNVDDGTTDGLSEHAREARW